MFKHIQIIITFLLIMITPSDWMITYLTLVSLKVKEDNYRHLFSKKNKLLKNNI